MTGAVISEAVKIDDLIVAPVIAMPFLLILTMIVMFKKPSNKNKSVRIPER